MKTPLNFYRRKPDVSEDDSHVVQAILPIGHAMVSYNGRFTRRVMTLPMIGGNQRLLLLVGSASLVDT